MNLILVSFLQIFAIVLICYARSLINGIIIFIILAVITSSAIDEASSVILTMRALGYKPRQANFIVIVNYVLGVLFTFFLAHVISLLIGTLLLTLF